MAALVGISVKPASGGYTCKVPLDLLAQDGVPPEKGDSVDYSVSGTVQSVDAEDAVVKIDSVNGEPVAESPDQETAEDQSEEGGPPQPGGQAGGASGAGGRGWPAKAGAISPATLALGAALRKRARGQPLPF